MSDENLSLGNVCITLILGVAFGFVLEKKLRNLRDDIGENLLKEEEENKTTEVDKKLYKIDEETNQSELKTDLDSESECSSEVDVFDNPENDIMRSKTPLSECSRISTPVHVEYNMDEDDHGVIDNYLKTGNYKDLFMTKLNHLDSYCQRKGKYACFTEDEDSKFVLDFYNKNMINSIYLYRSHVFLTPFVCYNKK